MTSTLAFARILASDTYDIVYIRKGINANMSAFVSRPKR
jgi:hypothetical protein